METTIQNFLNLNIGNLKPGSFKCYKAHLNKYLLLGKPEYAYITDSDVVRFRQCLTGHVNTIGHSMRILKVFSRYVKACFPQSLDPYFIKAPKSMMGSREVATQADVDLLCSPLNEWEYSSLLRMLVIKMLFSTGMRVSEICEINLEQIENTKNYCVIKTKKNNRLRCVKWDGKSHELLLRYLGVRLTFNIPTDALFVSLETNKRITPKMIQRWFTALRKKVGMTKHITPHTERHGFTHEQLNKGTHIKTLQHMLGHTTIMALENYTQNSPLESIRIVTSVA